MIPHNICEVEKSTLSGKMFICVLQTFQGQQTSDLNLSEKPTRITSDANLLFIKMPFFICRPNQSHFLIMRSVYDLQNLFGTSGKVGLVEPWKMLIRTCRCSFISVTRSEGSKILRHFLTWVNKHFPKFSITRKARVWNFSRKCFKNLFCWLRSLPEAKFISCRKIHFVRGLR